jgi:hypothetical protein
MTGFALVLAASMAAGQPNGDYPRFDVTDSVNRIRLEVAAGCPASEGAGKDAGKPVLIGWTGKVISRREGEPDRHLFDVQGVNPRACQLFNDPVRGPGYRATARELMIYLDPATGKLLDRWQNPWTGETVEVVHMVNDPASMAAPVHARKADGTPTPARRSWQDWGDSFIQFDSISRFGENPMGGAYQPWVGGQYQAMENTAIRVHKSHVPAIMAGRNVPVTTTLVRITPWLPWMKMGSREGIIVIAFEGRTFAGHDALPEPLRGLIDTRWPLMRTAPAFDDARPFMNSWSAMKAHFDAQFDAQAAKGVKP